MQPNIEQKITSLEEQVAKIYKSVEQTRKMILWTGIITIAFIVLPLIGLLFAIPTFLTQFQDIQSLGL